MTNSTRKPRALRSIDPGELARVRGGMLYPAVKLSDAVIGVSAINIYLKYEGISGDATE